MNTSLKSLSKDSLYYFLLVLYINSSITNLTCNYLTDGALATTEKPSRNDCSAGSKEVVIFTANSGSVSNSIAPNPRYSDFTLTLNKNLVGRQVRHNCDPCRWFYNLSITKYRYGYSSLWQ